MSSLHALTGRTDALAGGWPEVPTVYEAVMDLTDLFSVEAARQVVGDRYFRPIEMAMVRDGQVTGEPCDVDSTTSTLGLNGLHLTWPPIAAFTRRLAAETGHIVTGNVYRTPPHSRGYGPHWDTHHVLLAQVHGAKHWKLFKPTFPHPSERHNWVRVGITTEERDSYYSAEGDFEITLRAGQVLLIPRGWIHFAHTGDAPSLHVTLGIRLADQVWVLEQILDLAREDVALRMALPPHLQDADPAALVNSALAAFTDWLASPAAAQLPAELARRAALRSLNRP